MIRTSPAPLAAALGVLLLAATAGCAASASAGAAGGPGGPEIVRRSVARYEFYDVGGRTAEELETDMLELGPEVAGRPAMAATFWDVGWSYRTESAAGRCVVRRVEMRLDVRVRLPRWRRPADADPALVADWSRFVLAVSEHEGAHVDLAAEAARRIRSRLIGLSGPNCAALQARVREEGDRILTEYRERNLRFDEQERPGTDAEQWPPRRSRSNDQG